MLPACRRVELSRAVRDKSFLRENKVFPRQQQDQIFRKVWKPLPVAFFPYMTNSTHVEYQQNKRKIELITQSPIDKTSIKIHYIGQTHLTINITKINIFYV